ncbi:MAG: M42 family peptidase, partial [Clostridia bacterium]|nr:M42 family peptidase [Clostridia bacterium]
MDIKSTLFALSCAVGIGNLRGATDLAESELKKYAAVSRTDNLGITGVIKGERDYTVMLEAHIDEIGFIVTDVDENGFLTVTACGGID